MKKIFIFIISTILLSTSVFATTEEHIKTTVETIVTDMYTGNVSMYASDGLYIALTNVDYSTNNCGTICIGWYELYCTYKGWSGTVTPQIYIFNGILDLSDDEADELLMFYLPPTLCELECIIADSTDIYTVRFEKLMENVRIHGNEELYLTMLSSTFQKTPEKMLEKMRNYKMQVNSANSELCYWSAEKE